MDYRKYNVDYIKFSVHNQPKFYFNGLGIYYIRVGFKINPVVNTVKLKANK